MCARACACVRACVCACVCARACACVRARTCVLCLGWGGWGGFAQRAAEDARKKKPASPADGGEEEWRRARAALEDRVAGLLVPGACVFLYYIILYIIYYI